MRLDAFTLVKVHTASKGDGRFGIRNTQTVGQAAQEAAHGLGLWEEKKHYTLCTIPGGHPIEYNAPVTSLHEQLMYGLLVVAGGGDEQSIIDADLATDDMNTL